MYFKCSIAIRYSPIIFTGKPKFREKRRRSVNMPDRNRKRRQKERGKRYKMFRGLHYSVWYLDSAYRLVFMYRHFLFSSLDIAIYKIYSTTVQASINLHGREEHIYLSFTSLEKQSPISLAKYDILPLLVLGYFPFKSRLVLTTSTAAIYLMFSHGNVRRYIIDIKQCIVYSM